MLEHDPAAEDSFRNLRSSLLLIQQAKSRRTLLFTSAHPGEGKTFCAMNCAISFAQLGLETLIVDADVRQSDLAHWFFPEAPPTGSILRTDVPNLSAVFTDKAHANAQEFLPGLTFEQLMRQAVGKFDRIVVDSAPVNLVSDTLLYARHVQSVCLVIKPAKLRQKTSFVLRSGFQKQARRRLVLSGIRQGVDGATTMANNLEVVCRGR